VQERGSVTADQPNSLGNHKGLSSDTFSDDLELLVRSLTYCKSFKCDFWYGCAAVNNISTDRASRGPLR